MTRFQSGESLASQVYAFDREFVLPPSRKYPREKFRKRAAREEEKYLGRKFNRWRFGFGDRGWIGGGVEKF